jgi:hypothetical protein
MQFQDGPHLLTVNVTVSNQQTFWFDQIQYYAPFARVSLNQSLLRIDSRDSEIQYSNGWNDANSNIDGDYTFTFSNGAALTYEFYGSSLVN